MLTITPHKLSIIPLFTWEKHRRDGSGMFPGHSLSLESKSRHTGKDGGHDLIPPVPDQQIPAHDNQTTPVKAAAEARRRLLVVEDESIIALDLITTLEQMGYTVVAHAMSATRAIQEAASTQPDLILMDIRLNDVMDGIEAAQQIRASFSDVRVIFLTAFADEDTIQRVTTTKLGSYLRKPYSRYELQTAIEHEF